jgi:hypothetical protein
MRSRVKIDPTPEPVYTTATLPSGATVRIVNRPDGTADIAIRRDGRLTYVNPSFLPTR